MQNWVDLPTQTYTHTHTYTCTNVRVYTLVRVKTFHNAFKYGKLIKKDMVSAYQGSKERVNIRTVTETKYTSMS